MLYIVLILGFSAAQIGLGFFIARRVKGSGDFFVAGRALGPGLIFSTFLAANIGAGSTIGAAGLGYRDGLAAWWWVGSAGIGSVILATLVGPRIRRLAAEHDLSTVGDFLEWRYDARVRAAITALLSFAALSVLAGQLIGLSWLLDAVAGWPKWVGCTVGGIVVTAYSTAGGLKSTAWVNMIQLAVKLLGFSLALPLALHAVGGFAGLQASVPTGDYWNFFQHGASGWPIGAMLIPAFICSPGLLQKIYGARDDRAVRLGVGANAIGLLLYAIMPVMLGMIARALHPNLTNQEMALPTLLVHDVPLAVGALGIAALFSAEASAADAGLFIMSTALSKDLYRRFINPTATDRQQLSIVRIATVICGVIGIGIAIIAPTIIDALKFFYTLMSVSLFIPVVAGLYNRRATGLEALAAILAGACVVIAIQFGHGGRNVAGLTPAMLGLASAGAAWLLVALTRRK
jgi:SSS family solute:Na+ symporter